MLLISLLGICGCRGCVEQPSAVDVAKEVPVTVEAQPAEPTDPQEPVSTAPLDRSSSTVTVPAPEGDADANGDGDGDADADPSAASDASSPTSAQDALREARDLRRQAQSAQSRGNYGNAFRDASAAWSALRPFQDDPACRGLCEALEVELNDFARAANRQIKDEVLRTRTLIEK